MPAIHPLSATRTKQSQTLPSRRETADAVAAFMSKTLRSPALKTFSFKERKSIPNGYELKNGTKIFEAYVDAPKEKPFGWPKDNRFYVDKNNNFYAHLTYYPQDGSDYSTQLMGPFKLPRGSKHGFESLMQSASSIPYGKTPYRKEIRKLLVVYKAQRPMMIKEEKFVDDLLYKDRQPGPDGDTLHKHMRIIVPGYESDNALYLGKNGFYVNDADVAYGPFAYPKNFSRDKADKLQAAEHERLQNAIAAHQDSLEDTTNTVSARRLIGGDSGAPQKVSSESDLQTFRPHGRQP